MSIDQEIDHLINQMTHDLDQHQRHSTLNRLTELLRHKGSSPHTIQTTLQDLHTLLQAGSPHNPHPSQQPDTSPPPTPSTPGLWLSDVQPRPLDWLWPQRIPLGKLTLLEGDSGSGTSLFALTLAAAISSGQPLPGDTPVGADSSCPSPIHRPNNVILLAPHDHPADTLLPRLQAAGGDPSHILLLNTIPQLDSHQTTPSERLLSLPQDLDHLEATIQRLHAVLVIIDPFTPLMNRPTRQHTHTLLVRLAQIAQRTHCAILLIRPLSPGRAARLFNHRPILPSSLAPVPSILLLAPSPSNPNARFLISTKHTLSSRPPDLTLYLTQTPEGLPLLRPPEHPSPSSPLPLDPSALSRQRQTILHLLQHSPTPLSPVDIALGTGLSYEAVRLLLIRMHDSGTLARPSRGTYTTLDHPSLQPQQNTHASNSPPSPATTDTTATNPVSEVSLQNERSEAKCRGVIDHARPAVGTRSIGSLRGGGGSAEDTSSDPHAGSDAPATTDTTATSTCDTIHNNPHIT